MQKYSTVFLFKKIKNYITSLFFAHKLFFISYFFVVLIGIVVGVLLGRNVYDNASELFVENYIIGFICGENGLLSVFLSRIVFYVIAFLLSIFVLFNYKWGITYYVFVFFYIMRSVKNAVVLILCGGLENLLCAILFYLIFDLIFVILFSFFVINIIICGKYKGCKRSCGKAYCKSKSLILQYVMILLLCLVVSIVLSLPFILISI